MVLVVLVGSEGLLRVGSGLVSGPIIIILLLLLSVLVWLGLVYGLGCSELDFIGLSLGLLGQAWSSLVWSLGGIRAIHPRSDLCSTDVQEHVFTAYMITSTDTHPHRHYHQTQLMQSYPSIHRDNGRPPPPLPLSLAVVCEGAPGSEGLWI